MAERPDLEFVEALLNCARESNKEDTNLLKHSTIRDLLTYCRELEAENKRLLEPLPDLEAKRCRQCRGTGVQP